MKYLVYKYSITISKIDNRHLCLPVFNSLKQLGPSGTLPFSLCPAFKQLLKWLMLYVCHTSENQKSRKSGLCQLCCIFRQKWGYKRRNNQVCTLCWANTANFSHFVGPKYPIIRNTCFYDTGILDSIEEQFSNASLLYWPFEQPSQEPSPSTFKPINLKMNMITFDL